MLRGDEAAWSELYGSTFRSIYAYVYHRTSRQRERTDEIIQETWMVAVRRIRSFDPDRASFEAWVRGIALNVLRNLARQWSRQNATTEQADVSIDAIPTGLPSARLDLAEQIALAMTELPARYQSVLRARYEQEHSLVEIASQCGVSPKAAESLLGRARAAFRLAYQRLDSERP